MEMNTTLGDREDGWLFGEDVDEDSSQSEVGAPTRPGRKGAPKCVSCRQNHKKVLPLGTIVDSLVQGS